MGRLRAVSPLAASNSCYGLGCAPSVVPNELSGLLDRKLVAGRIERRDWLVGLQLDWAVVPCLVLPASSCGELQPAIRAALRGSARRCRGSTRNIGFTEDMGQLARHITQLSKGG